MQEEDIVDILKGVVKEIRDNGECQQCRFTIDDGNGRDGSFLMQLENMTLTIYPTSVITNQFETNSVNYFRRHPNDTEEQYFARMLTGTESIISPSTELALQRFFFVVITFIRDGLSMFHDTVWTGNAYYDDQL